MPWNKKYREKQTTNAQRNPEWKPAGWRAFLSFFTRVQDDPSPELSEAELRLQNFITVDVGGDIEFMTDSFHIWVHHHDERWVTEYLEAAGCYNYSLDTAFPEWASRSNGCCYIIGSFEEE